jgi:hypothetical protein
MYVMNVKLIPLPSIYGFLRLTPYSAVKIAVLSRFISVSGNPRLLERMNYNGFAAISGQ